MWIVNQLLKWFGHAGQRRTLTVGGLQRTYYVHVPAHVDPNTPIPAVVALHGATMNGPMMAWFTGLNQKADEAGFAVVYPDGTGSHSSYTWNGGNCCGPAMQNGVDDVGFIRALLDDLAQVVRVDPSRVYATGMSNGAVMAYRLASELSDRFAAIAPVAGPMGSEKCAPSRPVSVIHCHGTDDEYAPFVGGRGPKSIFGTNFFSVEHSIRAWVKTNGCNDVPAVEDLPDRENDGTSLTRKTFGGGTDGAEVVLVTIHGGGHTWPGRPPRSKQLGRATKNLSANDLMWEFFVRHPMR